SLATPGDWYVHLAVRDLVGNQFIRHYGPWHVGTFADASTNFANRVQTIVVDGQIDTDLAMEEWHGIGWEWGIFEFMDDFSPTTLLDWWDPQQMFTTWDGSNLYLGWSGAWWTLDGDLWIYLNTRPGSCTHPVIPMPTCPTLPFGADYAIHITSPTEGTLWECVGDTWQQAAGVDWEFAQGDGGHTEIRLALDMASIGELGLIAFALDDEGNPWAVFPTTNLLTNLCSESFVWTGLANITIPNEGQPLGADLLMSLGSLQAPQGAWCPGSPLEYVISLNNLEGLNVVGLALDVFATAGLAFESVVGADCDVCPPLGDAWTLHVPSIETDASHNITITGVLSDDLSSLTTVDISATLKLSDTILSHVNISHRVDNQPPTVDIAATPGQVIGTGLQTVAGTASDGTGSGVASVEYSVDGGNTWHQASGTMNWTANVDVPTGISTLELLARAADTCGYIGQDTETFNVDIYAPSVTPDLPQYVTGSTANLGGTATDDEGQVAQVEVQFDDQTATWRRGQVYSPDASGTQNWNYTWSLPREDCVDHTLRVRATDSAGNTVVSGWLDVTVDNVPPTLAVAGTLAEVSLQDPADPIVLNGTAGDGCGLSSLEVIVYAPDGSSFREATQWDGVNWQYTPDLDNWVAGEYTLRVEAVDQAGNTTLRGPFKVQALECLNPNLTATFLTAEPASSVRIEARVSNTGGGGAPDGLSVAFYANGDLIGTAPTSQMLTAGLSETVAITWDPALCGDYDITIALNDDGAGSNPLNLCSAPPDVQQTVSILDVP
ncbi:MAG: hypothetical protein FJ014_20035, partial [Chloroflexi bacterium]|nr:hypothetical protein [Chloroflexota bacterium]